MNTGSQSREVNISEELVTFEQKKAALIRAVKIAHAVEQLQAGLQDALILGKPTGEISGRAWETYQILAKQTKSHSDEKLKTLIMHLDNAVSSRIGYLLEASKSEKYTDESQSVEKSIGRQGPENVLDILKKFRKSAQTSAALRVVLHNRGIKTRPIESAIPAAKIKEQIHCLEQKEIIYRNKIKSEIVRLKDDIDLVLTNKKLPEDARAAAEEVKEGLLKDLEHITSGKKIESMPILIEVVEMQSIAPIHPEKHLEEVVKEAQEAANSEASVEKSSNFWQRLYAWLTTPPNVSWKDTNKRF